MSETNAVAEQKPQTEQKKVLIVGTTEKGVVTYLKGYATKRGLECVVMPEADIQAYLNKTEPKYKDSIQAKSLKAFVESEENRIEALNQAIKLYTILSGNKGIEGSENFVFRKTDAVHKTTLSHKQFDNVVNMWEIFNMIEKVDHKQQMYRFKFNKEDQRTAISNGVKSLVRATVTDITRYNANIDADGGLTDEEKAAKKEEFLNSILAELK